MTQYRLGRLPSTRFSFSFAQSLKFCYAQIWAFLRLLALPLSLLLASNSYGGPTDGWTKLPFDFDVYGLALGADSNIYLAAGTKIVVLDSSLIVKRNITIPNSGRLTSVTYLNGNLWVGDIGAKKVYRVDIAANVYYTYSNLSAFPDSLGTDGKYIYIQTNNASGQLAVVDPAGGTVLRYLSTAVPDPTDITWDGSKLIVIDESGGLYAVSKDDGQTVKIDQLPSNNASTFSNGTEGVLYALDNVFVGYGAERYLQYKPLSKIVQTAAAEYDPVTKALTIPNLRGKTGEFQMRNLKLTSQDGKLFSTAGPFDLTENTVPAGQPIAYYENIPVSDWSPNKMSINIPTLLDKGSTSISEASLTFVSSESGVLKFELYRSATKRPEYSSALWKSFLKQMRPGDILLFAEEQTCTGIDCLFVATENGFISYGFLSHAALVVSTSTDGSMIQVFHARNPTQGVGVNWYDESIGKYYKEIRLVRPIGTYDGASVVAAAQKKYSNYYYDVFTHTPFFAYSTFYGIHGTNSTYCSDLVAKSYSDFGINLRDQDTLLVTGNIYFKKGPVRALFPVSTIFTPDELSFSNNINYIDAFRSQ